MKKKNLWDSNRQPSHEKKQRLSSVRNKLAMSPPIPPLCVIIANAYKFVYINYVTQIAIDNLLTLKMVCSKLRNGHVYITYITETNKVSF